MIRLLLLIPLISLCSTTTESRLNAPTQRKLDLPPPRLLQEQNDTASTGTEVLQVQNETAPAGTEVLLDEDLILEGECEIIVSMIIPNFEYTVGGPNDILAMSTNLIKRSTIDVGTFNATNITEAILYVQKVMPLTPETGRRLFNDDRLRSLTTTSYSSSTTRRPVWGFNIARFMASISQCRSCYLDNSDKRRRRLRKPQNVDNDNWFAYKYLRSIQKTSDWLDDATYLRVQANCTTIQIDGAYDATSVSQRKLYKSLYDDEIHSATGRDEI